MVPESTLSEDDWLISLAKPKPGLIPDLDELPTLAPVVCYAVPGVVPGPPVSASGLNHAARRRRTSSTSPSAAA